MAARRKDDEPMSRTRFRTERVVHDNGKWYFLTREGSVEGPFECEADATNHLEMFVRVAQSALLPNDSKLALCD